MVIYGKFDKLSDKELEELKKVKRGFKAEITGKFEKKIIVFQKLIENYANENEGQFPDHVMTLDMMSNNKIRQTINDFKNPLSTGLSQYYPVLDYTEYITLTRYLKNKCDFGDLILYEPKEVISTQKLLPKLLTYGKYRIYGTDKCGELIKQNGKVFILERKKFHIKADLKTYKLLNPNRSLEKGNL